MKILQLLSLLRTGGAGALRRRELQEDPETLLTPIVRVVGRQFFVDHSAVLDYSANPKDRFNKLWLKK